MCVCVCVCVCVVKTLKNLLLQNQWTDMLETWYIASVC